MQISKKGGIELMTPKKHIVIREEGIQIKSHLVLCNEKCQKIYRLKNPKL